MQALIAIPKGTFSTIFEQSHVDRLRSTLTLVPASPFSDLPDEITEDWVAELIGDIEIIFTGWGSCPLTDEMVASAPHTMPVRRLDEVTASRKPNVRWKSPPVDH